MRLLLANYLRVIRACMRLELDNKLFSAFQCQCFFVLFDNFRECVTARRKDDNDAAMRVYAGVICYMRAFLFAHVAFPHIKCIVDVFFENAKESK